LSFVLLLIRKCMWTLIRNLVEGEYKNIADVYRHTGQRTSKSENIAEHSYFVTLLADIITTDLLEKYKDLEIDRYKILKYGIYHDFDEVYTWDIITPVKYKSIWLKKELEMAGELLLKEGLKESFLEQEHVQKDIINSFEAYEKNKMDILENQIVKFSDMLQYILFATVEARMWNQNFSKTLTKVIIKFADIWKKHEYLWEYADDLYREYLILE